MMQLKTTLRPLALAAALSVAAAACGQTVDDTGTAGPAATAPADETSPTTPDDQQDMENASDETASAGNPFIDLKMAAAHVGSDGSAEALAGGVVEATDMEGDIGSDAVQTYATLSSLLQEHVYLAGIAVDVAVLTSPDDPRFEAATAALDENSVALADVIGSVDPEQRDAFLALWREHIGFFVDYTLGKAGNEEQAVQAALADLDGYRQQAGAFFEQLSGGAIPADAVATSLQGHIETLTDAIDAAVARDTSVFTELKTAADHVGEDGAAKALAGGLAEALQLEGDIASPASQTYVTLSTLLQEHVYLAGIAVVTAYAEGHDSEAFTAATETLDTNSVELADLVGAVAPDQREAFLALWREHIGFFVDYALGAAGGDEAAMQSALDDLDGYRQQAGAFFEQITGGALPADAVAESLQGHIETLTTAIDGAAGAFAS